MLDFGLIISAFIAGLLTFLAPCTLPLVPGYLAFISGTSIKDLADPKEKNAARRRIFLNGLAYVIGFSLVFVAFGSLFGLLGSALTTYRLILTRVAGVLVILFGLVMLNVIKIPWLSVEKQVSFEGAVKKKGPLSSFVLGSSFAFGWTPCVGPILGSILLLASTEGTILQGTFLLSVFSLGLGIPFLAIALAIGSAQKVVAKLSKYLNVISIVGGILLILLGILLLTNNMALLITYGYDLLNFINYEGLLDHL